VSTTKEARSRSNQDEQPAQGHKISVVILSKDESELANTLELLKPQCEGLGAQCIVVDASEHRLEFIHQANLWTTWLDYSGPFWRSSTIPHQRNVGCRAAEGDIIAFCDSGLEPDENWLDTITAPLINGKFTLVCGPVFAKHEGVYKAFNDVADGEILASAATANMAFLKSVFDEVTGFDERLFYGSDTDFVWRCASFNHPCYEVRAAGMVMNFGKTSLTIRRSWRYGRGWARLFGLHPERRAFMMKESPERVVYPAWILFGPFAIFSFANRKLRWAPLAWTVALGFLLARNRKTPKPHVVLADHIIAGASVLDETTRRIVGEMAPVIFLPDDPSPYLRELANALTQQGTPVAFWRGPTKSATLNILLGPLWVALLAWRGVRIIHVHWTFGFARSSGSMSGRIARWWFEVFLWTAHAVGLKIIWTAHNVLPHEAVFDDDTAARNVLATRADAVIALSPHSSREISDLFDVSKVTVIPHGPLESSPSSSGREDARTVLNLGSRPCFSFFGNLRPYKGVETLIGAAELLGPKVAIRICGRGDSNYVTSLSLKSNAANAAGADIQIDARWRSDAELADLLAASDACVFPFTQVDNSSSVLLALAAGRPVIIPDLASLRHIKNRGVLRFDPTNPVRALSDVMSKVAVMSEEERVELGCAAREWALNFDWRTIAEETALVYAKALRGT
jgi:glycosyltransferase involved in cell wall biosynthesis